MTSEIAEPQSGAPTGPISRETTQRTPNPIIRTAKRFFRMKLPTVSLLFILLCAVLALIAPWIAPHDPNAQNLVNRFQGISSEHLLGTDDLGRDAFSRLLYGTRITLFAPFIALGVSLVIGLPTGILAGYRGGIIDLILSRIADALLALPGIILAIAIVAALGPSTTNAMIAVGFSYSPRLYRVARAGALVASNETFVEAAHASGCSPLRTMFSHVLPNALPPVLVQSSLLIGFAMLAEASLSFLGIGVQPPVASWGVLLRRGFVNIDHAPLLSIVPGAAISLTVMAYQFIGDGLRDAMGRELRRD